METLGNHKRKQGQTKPRRRKKRGHPFRRYLLRSVLALAPFFTEVVKLVIEITKSVGK